MFRMHYSRRLLGRQLSPSALHPRPVVASCHRPSCVASHTARNSWSWVDIAARNTAARIPGGRKAANWAYSRREDSHKWAASPAFPERAIMSRHYAIVGGDGGGSGGGSGNTGGGGGGEEAGDKGGWKILAWYMGLLDTNPILTKAVTSAMLVFIGDLFCQYVVEKTKNFDWKRSAVITFLGFVLVGPTLHFWYTALSTLVTVGGPTGVGIRLILDQFLFAPIFIGTFMSCLMTLEGRPEQVIAKLKQDWWSALVVNWKLWIPAQIINFWLVPLKLQVAFANFTALFWNTYLSYKSHLHVEVPQSLNTEAKT